MVENITVMLQYWKDDLKQHSVVILYYKILNEKNRLCEGWEKANQLYKLITVRSCECSLYSRRLWNESNTEKR